MAAASLAVRVSAQIAEFQKSFADMSKTVHKFAGDFEGVATRAAAVGTFFGNIAADIAGSLARGFGTAIRDAIKFSSEFSNAFTGLSSVARAFGTDAGLATTAAKQLSADGLLPVKDAATGLKNLLATGFSLPQAVKLMNAFKDSAAFGRAGALSFGDAIRTATEGVKNGNSILVDNAGITKNLSNILKDAGFSAQDLGKVSSDTSVRMALFNGILKEAAAFSGDAAKLTQTYSGALSALDSNWKTLLAAMGDAITKNAAISKGINFIGEAMRGLTVNLQNNKAGFNLVTEAVIILVRSLSSVLTAVDLVQTGFAGLQAVSNRVFLGIAKIGVAVFKFQEKAATLARTLDPLNWSRHNAAVNEAREAYTFLEGAVKGLSDATADTLARSDRYGNGIQTLKAKLGALQKDLESSRGKTVALGEAGITGGARLGAGVEAGATKAKKALKSLDAVLADIGGPHKLGLTSVPGTKLDLVSANLPFTMDFSGPVREGMEGLRNLPGDVNIKKIAEDMGKQFGTDFGVEVKGSLKTSLSNIPSVLMSAFTGGGGLSGAFKAIGVMLAESILTPIVKGLSAVQNTAISTGSALSAALGGQAGGGTVGAIAGIASGLGGAAIAATGWGTAMAGAGVAGTVALGAATLGIGAAAVGAAILIKKFTDAKGRNAVKDFAESFGGFDALHAKLGEELPADAERLWMALTQGVGRNNPEQAKAAIEAITAALEAQKTKQSEAAVTAEQTAAAIVAANEAAFAPLKNRIAELGQEYDQLFKSIENEAPEEVMGVIERQTRERMEAVAAERRVTEDQLALATDAAAAGFDVVTGAAEQSARDIERIFREVQIDPIRVPFEYSGAPGGFDVPHLARGGIVRRPTLALIGESGPEAVVPLSGAGKNIGLGGGDTYLTTQVVVDGRIIKEYTEKVTKQMAATGRLRPRVAAGRVY